MKSVVKLGCILMLLIYNVCYAQLTLRFQTNIDETATRLGDVLKINSDSEAFIKLREMPLASHPIPGERITKASILHWLFDRLGNFEYTWQGKTQIQVQSSHLSSGTLLIDKAKTALINTLAPQYLRLKVTPLSQPKDSIYHLDDIRVKTLKIPFPTSKRVCVWLASNNDHTTIPIWFKINAYANVLVANHDIRYNTPLKNNLFSTKTRNVAGLSSAPVQTIPQHTWLKSSIKRNTLLVENQLKPAPLIRRNQHINLINHRHAITIIMDVVALADGYLGDTITVKNLRNHKIFQARISGLQQAEVV